MDSTKQKTDDHFKQREQHLQSPRGEPRHGTCTWRTSPQQDRCGGSSWGRCLNAHSGPHHPQGTLPSSYQATKGPAHKGTGYVIAQGMFQDNILEYDTQEVATGPRRKALSQNGPWGAGGTEAKVRSRGSSGRRDTESWQVQWVAHTSHPSKLHGSESMDLSVLFILLPRTWNSS